MGKFPLDLFNFRVGDCPSDESLERADSVAEVGSLESLCRLADRPLLETEGNERSVRIRLSVLIQMCGAVYTYGVARLDTSFVMMSIPRCLATPI